MTDTPASSVPSSPAADPATDPAVRSVDLTRDATGRYTARNAAGATVTFGRADDLMSPVELLLAALAGCSAVDVDTVTSRRAEPDEFRVAATGRKVVEEGGATRVEGLHLSFHLAFDDDDAGREAAGMVDRLVALSHDKHCTVSRTIEHGSAVGYDVDVRVGDQSDGGGEATAEQRLQRGNDPRTHGPTRAQSG